MDKELICQEKNCNTAFIFTAGEQDFFESKGFSAPKRCPECREKKKKQSEGKDRQ